MSDRQTKMATEAIKALGLMGCEAERMQDQADALAVQIEGIAQSEAVAIPEPIQP